MLGKKDATFIFNIRKKLHEKAKNFSWIRNWIGNKAKIENNLSKVHNDCVLSPLFYFLLYWKDTKTVCKTLC